MLPCILVSLAAVASFTYGQQCICLEELSATVDLRSPISIHGAGDGSGRLYVAEQVGIIWIIEDGERLEPPFLDIEDRVLSGEGEQGMLSILFHPDYSENGRLFVYYSFMDDDALRYARLSEFYRDPDNPYEVDPETEKVILDIEQPHHNHNGGDVRNFQCSRYSK